MAIFEENYFDCQCSDFGHTIRFVFDPKDGDVWLEVHLYNWLPWYKRLWAAFLYVIKRHKPYGHYDTTMLRSEDFARLHSLLDRAELKAREVRLAALKGPQEKPLLKG